MKNLIKLIYLTVLFSLLFYSCEKAEETRPLKAANESDYDWYYENFPTIDSAGDHKNPIRIEVYTKIDSSIVTDFNTTIGVRMFDFKSGLMINERTTDLNGNGFLLWHLYEQNTQQSVVYREGDTVQFSFQLTGIKPGVNIQLAARTYYDLSDTIFFNTDAAFMAIIPKRGSDFDHPNHIKIEKIP